MSTIGNILWFLFGGFFLAAGWLFVALLFYITIIGAPIGRACFEFAKLSAFPFGKKLTRNEDLDSGAVAGARRIVRVILNIVWIPIGLCMLVAHYLIGIVWAITIIGIPIAIVNFRMGSFVLAPVGVRVVEK